VNKAYPFELQGNVAPALVDAVEERPFDLQTIVRIVRNRLGLIVAVFLLTFATVAVITFQMTPVYNAFARVIIDPRAGQSLDINAMIRGQPVDSALVDTEVEVMSSQALIGKVVRELDLVSDPEFNWRLTEPSAIDRTIGDLMALVGLGGAEEPAPLDPEVERQTIEDEVVEAVRNQMRVQRLGATYIIEVTASSTSPQRAAELANTTAALYLDEQLEAKYEATERTNRWLNERLSTLRDEVNQAEALVEQYRSRAGLISAQGSTLTEQQIASMTAEKVLREAELAERRARLQTVRDQIDGGASPDAITEALSSPVMADLRRQQAEVNRRRAELQARVGPRHPDLLRINSEEADLSRQIDAELQRIVASLESEVVIARDRVNSLNSSLSQIQGRLMSNNSARVQLNELERNAEASRTLYESFLARFKASDEQEALAEADARVISSATPPLTPSSPRTSLNLAIGVVVGLLLAGLATVLVEAMDSFVSSGEEIERRFGVPYIGQVPMAPSPLGKPKMDPGRYLVEKPHSAFAESFRNIRASIIFADLDKAARTVAITSCLPDEGKTTITYCLGRLSAMSGTKTIVIDGDFRRRQLTEIAGVNPERGLLEYLFGETNLVDALHVDEATGMHMLPLTDRKHTPRDVFGSRAFDALLATLKQSYDLIVIDTGPLLLMAETRVVTSKADQVIMAARWRRTHRSTLGEGLTILKDFKANLRGVVLTMVDLRRRRHSGQGSANYKAYEKYYVND
jgi:exopolysaccharide transport family protein